MELWWTKHHRTPCSAQTQLTVVKLEASEHSLASIVQLWLITKPF